MAVFPSDGRSGQVAVLPSRTSVVWRILLKLARFGQPDPQLVERDAKEIAAAPNVKVEIVL
jgi:hypothetical protein